MRHPVVWKSVMASACARATPASTSIVRAGELVGSDPSWPSQTFENCGSSTTAASASSPRTRSQNVLPRCSAYSPSGKPART